jgi:hypothetical protein
VLKPFLLVFDSTQMDRQTILNWLDKQSVIKNWFAFLPNAIVLISDQSTFQLSELIRVNSKPLFDFVITEVINNGLISSADGSMSKQFWDFINVPKSSGKWG